MIGWMLAQLVVSTQCCDFRTGEVFLGNLRNSNLKLADDNRLFHIGSDKPLMFSEVFTCVEKLI